MQKYNLEKKFELLVSMDIQEKDGYTWFSASNRNGIYQINNKTHNVVNKYIVEDENFSEFVLYHDMEISENKIFFAPHKAKCIAVYDINKEKIQYLTLNPIAEKYHFIYNPNQKFGSVFKDGLYVYLLGYTYPAIVKIHIETLEMQYIDSWVDEVMNGVSAGDARGYFTVGSVKTGRKILLPLGYMCGVLELDLDTDKTRLIKLDSSLDGIGGIAGNAKDIWIIGRGKIVNKIVRWNIQNNELQEIDIPIDENDCVVPFHAPLCYKDKVFLFPIYANYAYEIEIIDERINICKLLETIIQEKNKKNDLRINTFSPRITDGKIKFITGEKQEWYEYDLENGQIESCLIRDNDNIDICIQEYAKRSINEFWKTNIVWESFYQLNDYIDVICFNNEKKCFDSKRIMGREIFSVLRNVK